MMPGRSPAGEVGLTATLSEQQVMPARQPGGDFLRTALCVLSAAGVGCVVLYVADEAEFVIYVLVASLVPAILLSPLLGASLVAMSLPMAGLAQLIPGMFTASKALALLTAVSLLPRQLFRTLRDLFSSGVLCWYLFISGYWLLVFPLAWDPDQADLALVEAIVNVQMGGLAFIVAAIPQNVRDVQRICLWATLGGAILGITVSVLGLGAVAGAGARLAAGTNANAVAHALSVGLILSGVAWYRAGLFSKVLILILDFLVLASIGLSQSRAAWVSLPAAVIGAALVVRGTTLRHKAGFLVVSGILASVGTYLVIANVVGDRGDDVIRRYDQLVTERTQTSGSRIEVLWPMYLEQFRKSPAIGNGPGLTRILGKASHNDWLKLAAELGLIGIAMHMLMFVLMCQAANRLTDPTLRIVMLCLVLFLLLFGMTHNTFMLKSFPLAVGVLAALIRVDRGNVPVGISADAQT